MQGLSNQQLKEIESFLNQPSSGAVQAGSEAEFKEIRKNFKNANTVLSQFTDNEAIPEKERQAHLITLLGNLIETSQKYEDQLILLKLNNALIKQESENMNLQNGSIVELKEKYSKVCIEISDAIKQIKSANKQMEEAEDSQRKTLIENFENSLKDITSKIDEQDKEREEKEKENEQLREEVKKKVAEFEEQEKVYVSNIQSKETEIKGKVESFLGQIKAVEVEAQDALKLRTELQHLTQSETEKKLKIALYTKRIDELVSSIDKTTSTLKQFKDNLIQMYWKLQKLQSQNKTLNEQVKKGDASLITILQNNAEIEKQIENVKKQKEIIKQRVLDTQAQIKALNAPPPAN